MDSNSLGYGAVRILVNTKISGYVNGEKCLDQLSYYQLLTKDFVRWT
jgi:hypothetical protein